MRYYFDFAMQDVICETGEAGLTLTVNGVVTRLGWDDITGAGLAEYRPRAVAGNVPLSLVPGLPQLARFVMKHEASKQDLLMACRGGRSGKRLLYLSVPLDGGLRRQFLAELEERLGTRWISGPLPDAALRKQLGFGSRRQLVTGVAAVVVICLLVLLLMLGYQAAAEAVWSRVYSVLKGLAGG